MATTNAFSKFPLKLTSILSVLVALLPIFFYAKEFGQVVHDQVFLIIEIILFALTVVFAGIGLLNTEVPPQGWKVLTPWVLAMVAAAWGLGWGAQYRSDTKQGIEYKYTKPKTSENVPTPDRDSSVFLLS